MSPNYVYRSLKCVRDGNLLAARLEASLSIPLFFDAVFALHDGRLRPYYKYLKWELETFPLEKIHMSSKEILESISKILDSADVEMQQKLLKIIENVFRKEYRKVFDGWGNKLDLIRNYQSSEK